MKNPSGNPTTNKGRPEKRSAEIAPREVAALATPDRDPIVPVFASKTANAWPAPENGVRVHQVPLSRALTTAWRTDAHFAAYSSPEVRRLGNDALGKVPIAMRLLVADVDDPEAHQQGTPARPEWHDAEAYKLGALSDAHPGLYSYRTRGGYRLIYRLGEPFALKAPEDKQAWWTVYGRFVALLATFSVEADPACKDFCRLYRLPCVVRDGHRESFGRAGDPAGIATIDLATLPPERHPFVAAAFKDAIHAVRSATNGHRNDILNREAFSLGGLVGGGHLDRDEVANALLAAIVANGGEPEKDAEKIGVALDAGAKQPRALPKQKKTRGKGSPPITGASRASADPAPAGAPEKGVDPTKDHDKRPEIRCGWKIHKTLIETIAALRSAPSVFVRDGRLVVLTRATAEQVDASALVSTDDGPRRSLVEGAPRIYEATTANLRVLVSAAACCKKFSSREGDWVPTNPPKELLESLHDEHTFPGIRPIVGVIEAPTMRPDGSLVQTPGYDEATGYLYAPSGAFPEVPEQPTQADARAAYAELADVFGDFPHEDDNREKGSLVEAGAHKAALIAHAMTAVARAAIPGAVPLFCFDANIRGSGKTLQTDAVALIVTGRAMPRMTFPENDTELEKCLAAYALQGTMLFSLDNVARALGGASLDRVLTALDTVQFRVLGFTRVPTMPWRAVGAATGNNLSFAGDTVRRAIVSRLESFEVRPEERERFKYPDLLAHIRANRSRLVVALLTIARAYVHAGRPDMNTKRWGGFEGWSGLIPPAIVFAGGKDPMRARPASDVEANAEVSAILTLISKVRAVSTKTDWTAAGLIDSLFGEQRQGKAGPDTFALREAVETLCGRTPTPRTLGVRLGAYKRRVFRLDNGTHARLVVKVTGGTAKWSVEKVDAS